MTLTPHPAYDEFFAWFKQRLPRARARRFQQTIYRIAGPTHTTAVEIAAGIGAVKAGGRWNTLGELKAVYGSFDADTAVAEAQAHYRYYGLPFSLSLPKVIVAIAVDVGPHLNLRSPWTRRKLPISMAELLADDWRAVMESGHEPASQALGRAAFDAGFGCISLPSNARRGGVNAVVFPDRLGSSDALEVMNPGDLAKLGK
jgi:RES domain-containing protein